MTLDAQIEAVLFYKAVPVKKSDLCRLFNIDETALTAALETLTQRLQNGGVRCLITLNTVQLVTAPESDELITNLRRDDMKRDIGKAGAETLAIILYREPISRTEIDQIRGVNSAFILRNLMMRGLIERQSNKSSYTYHVTPQLLQHLGCTKKQDLPQYSTIMDKLDTFLTANDNNHD